MISRSREHLNKKNPMRIQLNRSNSNCQGKLKLLRVIGVLSFGSEQKEQKHLIKVVLCLYMF